jgi:hypothetical protein
MTTKLDEMWEALAAYQQQADAAGHGKSWALMCKKKTYAAIDDAADAAAAYAAAYADAAAYAAAYADAAAYAAEAVYAAAYAADKADYWAQKAIDRIKEITNPPAAQREPVAWLYPEGLEALKAGKCWTAYGTKQDDNCNIPVYLNAAVAPKVEPAKAECGGFDSRPAAHPGDIRALKHRIHELEGELMGYKKIVADQDAMLETIRARGIT